MPPLFAFAVGLLLGIMLTLIMVVICQLGRMFWMCMICLPELDE